MPTYSFAFRVTVQVEVEGVDVVDGPRATGPKPPSDEVIRLAAEEYLQAKTNGHRDHLVRVAKSCGVARATAHRYLIRANDAGLIDYPDD